MKKLIVAGVMALSFLGAGAQTKIGYISLDEVIAAMPETDKANKELEEYQQSLGKQYDDLQKEANDKSEQFVKDSATYSPSMKEIKREEIIKLIQRVNNFQQEAQELTKRKAQEKFAPIQQKAMDAVKAVAKKSGYSYILDVNSVIVGPPGDDVASLVKKELGIKDAAAPATTPAKEAAPATKPAGKQ
ncbi:MAG: OmpH family outer membrane protein [Ferruginibacter sp.]|mgnify:CR=1 FL=1